MWKPPSVPGFSPETTGRSISDITAGVHLQIAFKKVLTSSGYRVELTSDGEEGLRAARSLTPDVGPKETRLRGVASWRRVRPFDRREEGVSVVFVPRGSFAARR